MAAKLLIFSKPFNSLEAKTRLRNDKRFSNKAITDLHNAMLEDMLSASDKSNFANIYIYWSEKCEPINSGRWVNRYQSGNNFTERFKNCLEDAFRDNDSPVAIIGSDCPLVSAEVLNQAYTNLISGKCVIGPTPTKDFYLLGLPKFINLNYQELFRADLQVENLINQLNSQKCVILEEKNDLDTKEDLYDLITSNMNLCSQKTKKCIQDYFIE